MTRPVPPVRADFGVFRPLQTRWADNDIYGHMNNVVHYALFDTAVNAWLVEEKLLDPFRDPEIFVVVATRCNYFAELAFPDALTAGLSLARLGTSSADYRIALFKGDEDQASAEGRFTHVMVDRQTRRPVPIAGALRDRLAALERPL